MDTSSIELLNNSGFEPDDINWWINNVNLLDKIKFNQRFFIWKCTDDSNGAFSIIDKTVISFDNLYFAEFVDNTELITKD